MNKIYKVTYHLATDVTLVVDNVPKDDADKLSKALENDNTVINISGRNAKITQLIPVRNVLAVEIEEE